MLSRLVAVLLLLFGFIATPSNAETLGFPPYGTVAVDNIFQSSPQDLVIAKKAAADKNPAAQTILAKAYFYGLQVSQDYEQVFNLFREVALQHFTPVE